MSHDKFLNDELTYAVDGHISRVRQLIKAGTKVTGYPLIMAIQCNEAEIVKELISAGSNVNILYKGTTSLIRAITASFPEIAALLIHSGADIKQTDEIGRTPLSLAKEFNLHAIEEKIKLLIT